jgi:hypothetical protein
MNPRTRSRVRPELEVLEDRVVPQATRTWVSGVGDDAGPCSRTAPGKTWAGAISKTAAGGEIDALDPGGFGAVTITKSITLDGGGNTAGVLVSGTNGVVVDDGGTGSIVVVLRGLDINGLGTGGGNPANFGINGIKIISAKAVYVENCTIQGFAQNGIDFEPATNCQLFVTSTIVRNNDLNGSSPAGIFVHPTGGVTAMATVDQSRMENNMNGLEADDNSQVTVSNSQAAGNSNFGFLAMSTTSPVQLTLNNDTEANNGLGAFQAVGAGATITVLPTTPAATPGPFLTPALPPGSLASTTTLTVTAVGNQSLVLIHVSGAAGPATGLVFLLDGDQIVGIAELSNGQAFLKLSRSHHTRHLQVLYAGDSNYAASLSFVVTIAANHVA